MCSSVLWLGLGAACAVTNMVEVDPCIFFCIFGFAFNLIHGRLCVRLSSYKSFLKIPIFCNLHPAACSYKIKYPKLAVLANITNNSLVYLFVYLLLIDILIYFILVLQIS